MAFPTILIDSATGSDGNTSGAGPTTALSGTGAATDVAGTTVDLSADAPDLSGVATDGSHAIMVVLGTAGVSGLRRWSKITGKDNTAKTVTVSPALTGSQSGKSWGIGGRRASINAASSLLLVDNAGTSGDAQAGWIVQFVSGHAETLNQRILFRINGDTTDGPFIFRGEPDAAVLPVLTWNTNDIASLFPLGAYNHIHDLALKNTNGTKTVSEAIRMQSSGGGNIRGINFNPDNDSGNCWWRDINVTGEAGTIENCKFGLTADDAIRVSSGGTFSKNIHGNFFNDISGICINLVSGSVFLALLIEENYFYKCAIAANLLASNSGVARCRLISNTIDGGGTAAYGFFLDNTNLGWIATIIENNTFSNLTTEALHFDDMTLPMINAYGIIVRGNNFYSVTSKYNISGLNSESELTVDPQFTDAAGLDFSVGTNLKAQAWPPGGSRVVAYSATRTYADIGAAQRICAAIAALFMRRTFFDYFQ